MIVIPWRDSIRDASNTTRAAAEIVERNECQENQSIGGRHSLPSKVSMYTYFFHHHSDSPKTSKYHTITSSPLPPPSSIGKTTQATSTSN
mmetsp:Transcript_37785/g.40981  ORF Transcript_37785/g.40981 Transcript_37785/m.40981 type:complete len:90 (+) Transcript_37785:639-908(+)